jgi:hypothetical protein
MEGQQTMVKAAIELGELCSGQVCIAASALTVDFYPRKDNRGADHS